jgi:hypothetical protein
VRRLQIILGALDGTPVQALVLRVQLSERIICGWVSRYSASKTGRATVARRPRIRAGATEADGVCAPTAIYSSKRPEGLTVLDSIDVSIA